MDYEKNQKYFEVVNMSWPNRIIAVGAILFIIGFPSRLSISVLGILAIAGGIAYRRMKNKAKISDSEYDASVASNLNNMKSRALAKLGIDEDEVKEAEPISFGGYDYAGATELKCGKDNMYRTNSYKVVTLFFSTNEVHCCTYTFSTTKSDESTDTDVYFYKDIVSVSTTSETEKVLGTNVKYEAFKLVTAGGTSISISLRDVENAQRSINAMRSLIRSKKTA